MVCGGRPVRTVVPTRAIGAVRGIVPTSTLRTAQALGWSTAHGQRQQIRDALLTHSYSIYRCGRLNCDGIVSDHKHLALATKPI